MSIITISRRKIVLFGQNGVMNQFPTLSLHQFDENGIEHELYVNTFSNHIEKHHTHVLVPHRHDFYVTVFFTQGSGFHEIDFQRYEINPGNVFFLQPGQIHHWEFSPDTEGFVLLHSRYFFELNIRSMSLDRFPFFFSRHNTPYMQISDTEEIFANQFDQLLREFEGKQSHKHIKSAALACALYIDFSRIYEAQYVSSLKESNHYAVKFRAFEQLLEHYYATEKSVEFYAEKLNISSRHLNRICREVAGNTFSHMITERVMLEARHLLTSGEMNLSQVALSLGYEEYSYFSKLFKHYTGMNARDFKATYQ